MLWHHKEPRNLKKDRGEVKGEKKRKKERKGEGEKGQAEQEDEKMGA